MTVTLDHWITADQRVFRTKKKYIEGALQGDTGIINGVIDEHKEDIFYMLMFCLCVPQSKAIKAEEAIDILRKRDYYNKTFPLSQLTEILASRVRFHSTKAKRLYDAKIVFFRTNFWNDLKDQYKLFKESSNPDVILQETRQTLIKAIKGMGMKLASHFLRNIGMNGLAILDVHVIDGLKRRGVINIEKLSSSQAEYLEIERKMQDYANKVRITLDQLDLLLWSQKTGYVFK